MPQSFYAVHGSTTGKIADLAAPTVRHERALRETNPGAVRRSLSGMAETPARCRTDLSAAISDLVTGTRPDLLTWVREYGESGAQLVAQPEDIWTHSRTDYVERADGTAYGSVPIWTTAESPSDLTAEFEIAADGSVHLTDVHVP